MLAAAAPCVFGQSDVARTATGSLLVRNAPMYTALYVLKSDLRSLELDPKKNEIFNVKSIDSRDVRFVTVLNRREGRKLYGEKGSNGVIIVQLADYYDLSKENLLKTGINK